MNATPHFDRDLLNKMEDHARAFDARHPGPMPTESKWHRDWNYHFDSAEGVFLARQLEFIRAGLYKVVYPDLKSNGLFPFDMSVDSGAEQHTVRAIDRVAQVKVTKQLAGNVPSLKMITREASTSIYSLVLGYQYTIQEARAAIRVGLPLSAMLAEATKEEMERKLDDIAFVGDTDSGVLGALNQPAASVYTVPANGTGATTLWANKTNDNILADLNGPPNQIYANSLEREIPDTWLLPTVNLNLLRARRVGDGTSMSVLAYYLGNQEMVKKVESTIKSTTAGAGSTARGMVYRNDPTKLAVIVSQPFEQMVPVTEHFTVDTACHLRTAGLELYLPGSVAYADGI